MILAIDEGTTNAKAVVLDEEAHLKSSFKVRIRQEYPMAGWVEQDITEIWFSQLRAIRGATARIRKEKIRALGITNQRETIILWDRRTGEPLCNAIIWQDRRGAAIVGRLSPSEIELIHERTGLIPDTYFSAPKLVWILEHNSKVRSKAEKGELCFGTVDAYLIWKLTGNKVHVTDYSNASRTMLLNIRRLEWDDEILKMLKIPLEMLPELRPSCGNFGAANLFGRSIPITGVAGDQQAALFGQAAFDEGEIKSTFGTGNFVLLNTGRRIARSRRLLSTVAWGIGKEVTYALEGSAFATGSVVRWAIEELKLARDTKDAVSKASSTGDTGGVYFVPAFSGLGSPHWDQYARGLIVGVTYGTSRGQVLRAVFESIAYQNRDILDAMSRDSGIKIRSLKVDGGGSSNDFLLQLCADILGKSVLRPVETELTSLGAGFLAGIGEGVWSTEELKKKWKVESKFTPRMSRTVRERLYYFWGKAVERAKGWEEVER